MHYHFVKEKIERGKFIPVYVPSKDNMADLLVRPLLREITRNSTIDLRLYLLGEKERIK